MTFAKTVGGAYDALRNAGSRLKTRGAKFRAGRWPRALVAAVMVCAAGCTRVGTAGAAHRNAWTHPGLLRIAEQPEPDNLNPLIGALQTDSDLAHLWGGFLFNYSDRDELVPELSTVVPTLRNGGISHDGKTYVYHLRRGVRWQDGAPFTADDVIFTWHAVMNKNNNVSTTVGYDLIASIDKRGPYELVVRLRRAYAPFVATFFSQSSSPYVVLPAHLLAKYPNINQIPFNTKPVGTGPFIVEQWQRGSKVVFRANPHYWRGRPKLDEVWYTAVPDENTIVTLLKTGEADLDSYAPAVDYPELSHIAGTRVDLTPFTQYAELALNLHTPPLADVRVRRALWYAIDVPKLIADVSHGVYTIGHTDQPAFSWAYDPSTMHYQYDPAKARALLDAAGWRAGPGGIRSKGGRPLTLVLASDAGDATGNAASVIVQRNFHDVGVDLRIKVYSAPLFFASYGAGGILQTSKFDLGFFTWVNGTDPDDSTNWMCDQTPPHGQNIYHFCDPSLDRAERIALTSNDQAVRKSEYGRIQTILAAKVPVIVLWYVRLISVYNTDLKEFRPAHAVTPYWNAYDWSI